MPRSILHVDMDAFFAAVEQRDDPYLRGKPVVVGGNPGGRGVVAAASYEAREHCINSAMPSAEAQRRCPKVIFIPPNHTKYKQVSACVMALLAEYTPLVEPLSVDEAFLDVTGSLLLFGSARRIGRQIRQRIWETVELTASVGIGPNKFIAKLASEEAKPDGLREIEADEVLDFLVPLPVEALPGVGEATAAELGRLGFSTVGDLQRCPQEQLVAQLGRRGQELYNRAWGIDNSPVSAGGERKSISHEQTFVRDTNDTQFLEATLLEQAEKIGRRLRAYDLKATTITLKLRFADFRTISRSTTLARPTNSDKRIYQTASDILKAAKLEQRKVRLIGLGASNFDRGEQPRLLEDDDGQASAVEQAVDEVRERFGRNSVRRARLVDKQQTETDKNDTDEIARSDR